MSIGSSLMIEATEQPTNTEALRKHLELGGQNRILQSSTVEFGADVCQNPTLIF